MTTVRDIRSRLGWGVVALASIGLGVVVLIVALLVALS